MPDPDMQLLAHAERQVPSDPGVRDCWGFVVEGIRLGWLSSAKIQKLIGHLREHEDYGLDELIFLPNAEILRVAKQLRERMGIDQPAFSSVEVTP